MKKNERKRSIPGRVVDRIKKFLARLDAKRRKRIEAIIAAIVANQLHGLDITPLKGEGHGFRCRAGDIRILFYRHNGQNSIYDIDFRGNIYKK